MISIFSNGRGVPAQGPLPPGIFGHRPGEAGVNPVVYEWRDGRARRRPLAEARARRDDARKLLTQGIDPSAQRKADKREAELRDANSFAAVALEWHGKLSRKWTAHHADDVKRRLESNLFPDLGDRPIADITAPELLAAARKVEGRGAQRPTTPAP